MTRKKGVVKDAKRVSIWMWQSKRVGFVVFLKLYLFVGETNKTRGSPVSQSSNLETINRSADLNCPEGVGRKGCISVTKYRFTELPSNADVLQEQRQAADISGKKMKVERSHCEHCMFSIMHNWAHDKYICSQSEKCTMAKLGAYSSLDTIEAQFLMRLWLWVSWYIPGVLSVGNMNVHKTLKFSVQGGGVSHSPSLSPISS